MKTFEVTFCYGERHGNSHGEVVRARTATGAITKAAKLIAKTGGDTPVKGNIDVINVTLFEVLVRELGFGS